MFSNIVSQRTQFSTGERTRLDNLSLGYREEQLRLGQGYPKLSKESRISRTRQEDCSVKRYAHYAQRYILVPAVFAIMIFDYLT